MSLFDALQKSKSMAKVAFQPMGGQPPAGDPNAMPPEGAPMDPAMGGAPMPPADPAMAAPAPAPMDPAMAGGAPPMDPAAAPAPAPEGGAPAPVPPELEQALQDPSVQQLLQSLGIQIDANGTATDMQTGAIIAPEELMQILEQIMQQAQGQGAPMPEGAPAPGGAPMPAPGGAPAPMPPADPNAMPKMSSEEHMLQQALSDPDVIGMLDQIGITVGPDGACVDKQDGTPVAPDEVMQILAQIAQQGPGAEVEAAETIPLGGVNPEDTATIDNMAKAASEATGFTYAYDKQSNCLYKVAEGEMPMPPAGDPNAMPMDPAMAGGAPPAAGEMGAPVEAPTAEEPAEDVLALQERITELEQLVKDIAQKTGDTGTPASVVNEGLSDSAADELENKADTPPTDGMPKMNSEELHKQASLVDPAIKLNKLLNLLG